MFVQCPSGMARRRLYQSWRSGTGILTNSPLFSDHRGYLLLGRCTRQKSTASVADFVPKSVRSSVKTSILDQVSRDDSRAWSSPNAIDDTKTSLDRAHLFDPLNDLYVQKELSYWPNLPPGVQEDADPFALSRSEVETLSDSIRQDLIGTDHPVLNQAAAYFFTSADGGKKVRPMMVMLLSRALADTMGQSSSSSLSNLRDGSDLFTNPLAWQRGDLPEAQRRLAEISEMIHTASLFHDDVIDGADTRRGKAAVHMVFGNKMAILAGDYLLARASISLARLRNVDVVETMSTIIEHLVRGEVMQMRGTSPEDGRNERMVYYLKKNYYKTASLMANSCRSAALLAECPPELVAACYNYGKHVGMAFQLVDDVLDFEGNLSSMGKPALADLNAGLATAPVLFAAEPYPELEEMMDRKFKQEGDVERARQLVFQSNGIERTKQLARVHAELSMEAAMELDNSSHRDALINLAYKVVRRTS
jgi:geranylgeranyl pyrophosphate synthase